MRKTSPASVMLPCITDGMQNAPCPVLAVLGLENPLVKPTKTVTQPVLIMPTSGLAACTATSLVSCQNSFERSTLDHASPSSHPAAQTRNLTPATAWSARACTAAVLGVIRCDPHAREDGSQQPSPRLVRLVLPLLLRPLGAFPGATVAGSEPSSKQEPTRRIVLPRPTQCIHATRRQKITAPVRAKRKCIVLPVSATSRRGAYLCSMTRHCHPVANRKRVCSTVIRMSA